MTTENRLAKVERTAHEIGLEEARRWYASAVHYGHPEAAKAWAEYIRQLERKAA